MWKGTDPVALRFLCKYEAIPLRAMELFTFLSTCVLQIQTSIIERESYYVNDEEKIDVMSETDMISL